MKAFTLFAITTIAFTFGANAEVKILTAHNPNEKATPAFKFIGVPAPSRTDAATGAIFSIIDGVRDENGGELDVLHDGKLPTEEDQPSENFFFNAGTEGGRLMVDLGKVIEVKQVNTYSWHPNTRGPQLYNLYASDGTPAGFDAKPGHSKDLAQTGWRLIA